MKADRSLAANIRLAKAKLQCDDYANRVARLLRKILAAGSFKRKIDSNERRDVGQKENQREPRDGSSRSNRSPSKEVHSLRNRRTSKKRPADNHKQKDTASRRKTVASSARSDELPAASPRARSSQQARTRATPPKTRKSNSPPCHSPRATWSEKDCYRSEPCPADYHPTQQCTKQSRNHELRLICQRRQKSLKDNAK